MSEGPSYFGKYRATVLNNIDPQSQGRIQVQLADRYGLFPSTWAMPAFPFAGDAQSGMVALPALGSMVWIEFEAGDLDYPIWTGAFYPDPAGFPVLAMAGHTPLTPNIHFQTSTGTSVTLSDNPTQQVMVKTATGAIISIGAAGMTLSNGQGAMISLTGPSVIINNGALTIT
ncbi:phage baseplate assembly protein V [Novosphingobium mangrovi (ex Hu et al. 2023)]|uniref:Phage baseplate assembly protein V n=1 Tax=Novosphingobium mangrovi (ex Hu et al. 2023) TaxID=2930094 RepID=A0ABT0ABB5_9SPHN|nr:phage baseplate assembly protein V [Novosphingobium mangrovi (ex Hu et al. 2023)]MCJ1960489.1 phage baseplate assembly protein V [Novosphingobium mangrovi (ex Hu et al. 2023)]